MRKEGSFTSKKASKRFFGASYPKSYHSYGLDNVGESYKNARKFVEEVEQEQRKMKVEGKS